MFARLTQFASTRFDRDRIVAFLEFTWHRFVEDRCMQTAGALSFTSIFALVPVTAAVLGILAAFPGFERWREQLVGWVFINFVPAAGTAVQGYITEFAANASKATAIGVLVLFFSSISLMMSIEDAFNRIWRVEDTRGASTRFLIYWAALTLGPLLLVAALAISSYAFALPFTGVVESQFPVKATVLAVLPFLILWTALVAGYMFIPNRSVSIKRALIGALIAALLFELAKRGFTLYATRYATYQQVYGALSMVPVFILWIYLSWALVLFGASITASLGAFDYRPVGSRLPRTQEFSGLLRVLAHLVAAQRQGAGLQADQLLVAEPLLTDDLLQRYLSDLHRVGLIRSGEHGEWVVVRDLASIDLLEIYEEGGYRLPLDGAASPLQLQPGAASLLDGLGKRLRESLAVPLADIFPATAPALATSSPASPERPHSPPESA